MKKSKFHIRLKELRRQYKYTQVDVARALGLSDTAIANYELERRRPEYETLARIADIFGVTTDYLIGRSNDSSIKSIPENVKNIALDPDNFDWILMIPYLKAANMKPHTIKNITNEIRSLSDKSGTT